MLDLINIEKEDSKKIDHLILFDTGIVKTLFRDKDRDCVKEFANIYHNKFGQSTYHTLTTANSFLELMGIANHIPKEVYNISLSEEKVFSTDFLHKNCLKFQNIIKKKLTRKYLVGAYNYEMNYPKNYKGVKIFLKNGKRTFLNDPNDKEAFYSMLSMNFFLSSFTLRKFIEKEMNTSNIFLRDLCTHVSNELPNQSLAYLLFALYAKNNEYKDMIQKYIVPSYIDSQPFKELLDFEIVHLLLKGFVHKDGTLIPVVFVTSENDPDRWLERTSLYSALLKGLNIPMMDSFSILSISQTKPEETKWLNYNNRK